MHVVYLTTEDLGSTPISGKVHFWALARELRARGHDVTIVAPRYTSDEIPAAQHFRIIRFLAPAKNALGLLIFEWTLWWHLGGLLHRLRPDVALVRGGGPGWFPGLIFWSFRLRGVPVVMECNGIVWREYRLGGKPWWQVANIWCSAWQQAVACNHIIGVSREIADTHRRLGGKPTSRAHVIPNGTDPADSHCSENDRRLARQQLGIPLETFVAGYVGTFSPWHNIRNLVAAAEQLDRTPPQNVCIILVGHGALYDWACQQRSARGIESLMLPGPVQDRSALQRWLACFDVGLCVNVPLHGSPLKVFEYLAAGIPVLGAGFPQVLQLCRDDGIGIGLASGDADSIVAALRQMAQDRDHWREVGRHNRQLAVERFSWGRVAEDVEAVLLQAAGRVHERIDDSRAT